VHHVAPGEAPESPLLEQSLQGRGDPAKQGRHREARRGDIGGRAHYGGGGAVRGDPPQPGPRDAHGSVTGAAEGRSPRHHPPISAAPTHRRLLYAWLAQETIDAGFDGHGRACHAVLPG
jgi:hypothetical protein